MAETRWEIAALVSIKKAFAAGAGGAWVCQRGKSRVRMGVTQCCLVTWWWDGRGREYQWRVAVGLGCKKAERGYKLAEAKLG